MQSKAGGTVTVRRTLEGTISRTTRCWTTRLRQLHDEARSGGNQPAHQRMINLASGKGLERGKDVTRNLSKRSRGFDTLPAKAQPASRKPALHGQRQRGS